MERVVIKCPKCNNAGIVTAERPSFTREFYCYACGFTTLLKYLNSNKNTYDTRGKNRVAQREA